MDLARTDRARGVSVHRFLPLALTVSVAAIAFATAGDTPRDPSSELVALEVHPPSEPPMTLEQSLTVGPLASLDAHLCSVRSGLDQKRETETAAAADRTEFDSRYRKLKTSAVANLLRAPQLASADHLVRSFQFNPRDIALPESEVELLRDLVEAHRAIIAKALQTRDLESHHQVLQLAKAGGVTPVASVRERLSASAYKEIAASAAKVDPTKGATYQRIFATQEARYAQALLGADSVLMHGGEGFLAPQGSILPGLSTYEDFVRERTFAMIIDALMVFSRNDAIGTADLQAIMAKLEGVAVAGPTSGV